MSEKIDHVFEAVGDKPISYMEIERSLHSEKFCRYELSILLTKLVIEGRLYYAEPSSMAAKHAVYCRKPISKKFKFQDRGRDER